MAADDRARRPDFSKRATKPIMWSIESRLGVALALAAVLVTGACSKKHNSNDTQTAAGDVVGSYMVIGVSDIALGRHLDANKRITDATSEFAPKDSVFASVHSTGDRKMKLTARWTFQDGRVIAERSETITPRGDAYTEFHVVRPAGWQSGTYTLHLLVDGNEVQTKDFTVK